MIPTSIGQALRWAAHEGHAYILALLLATESARAAINEPDHLGRSPLLIAAERHHPAAMAILLDHHADPFRIDMLGRNAEHILKGHLQTRPPIEETQAELEALVRATPSDNIEHSAAAQRARYLMDQGADPGRWTAKGTTVLHEAVTGGQRSVVRAFLEHPNAARNSQRHDRFDRSPLLLAVECHATDELLDDLLFRASVRSQMPEAIAAARTLGAPARARRLEEIHRQDLEAEQLLALDLMEM